jgi:hypothetical protein
MTDIDFVDLTELTDADADLADAIPGKTWILFPHYINVINEYLTVFSKSTKFSKPDGDNHYLLINGLNTLTNVFKLTLQQTCDFHMAIENMQKSIYYYTEFIEQMKENILQDLNISSNSASVFVYKKTIGDMKLILQKKKNDKQRDFIKKIENLILIHRQLFDSISTHNVTEIISKLGARG